MLQRLVPSLDQGAGLLSFGVPGIVGLLIQVPLRKKQCSQTLVGILVHLSLRLQEVTRSNRLFRKSLRYNRVGTLAHQYNSTAHFFWLTNNHTHSFSCAVEFKGVQEFVLPLALKNIVSIILVLPFVLVYDHIFILVNTFEFETELFGGVDEGQFIRTCSTIHALLLVNNDSVTDS